MAMRFMMLVRANRDTEAGVLPSRELLEVMDVYNEELVKAGVLLAMDGLHSSAKGTRVTWSGGKPVVTDGPFAEAKELIAGYWLIQVKSKEEAVEWASRAPFADGGVLEVRQVIEVSDFPAETVPPETVPPETVPAETVPTDAAAPEPEIQDEPHRKAR